MSGSSFSPVGGCVCLGLLWCWVVGLGIIQFQTGGEHVGCLAGRTHGLGGLVTGPPKPCPCSWLLWVLHIKIVKIRPSPLPPTSRAVSISIHSQALLRGVSDDQYLHQIVYCLLRTTIKSYSHLELYLDNHLYNPYSTSGLLQV